MEKFAYSVSEMISKKLGYDEDKRAVIAYGLIAIFQMTSIFLFISAIGLLGGFWYESLVIFIAVGLLRKATGGAHSETMQGCMVISVFSISFLAFLSKYLIGVHLISYLYFLLPLFLIYGFSFVMVYKFAPIDSPRKPIVNPEKIKKLRQKSFMTLLTYCVISVILVLCSRYNVKFVRFINLSLSLSFATVWQVFTLTKAGRKLVDTVDYKFRMNN